MRDSAQNQPGTIASSFADPSHVAAALRGAHTMFGAFQRHQVRFREITRRAAARHRDRDWRAMQSDAVERLELYEHEVSRAVLDLQRSLDTHFRCKACWTHMKAAYSEVVAERLDAELAKTFFNSATRRIFTTVGVDPQIEYVGADFEGTDAGANNGASTTYGRGRSTLAMIQQILSDLAAPVPYQDLDRDARLISQKIEGHRQTAWGSSPIETIDVLNTVLYRNKGAYLVGRILGGGRTMPLVIALVNEGSRMVADAVLLTEDEASIVFSFTRSAFHAVIDNPREVIQFLKSIMPAKRIAELYTALGYNKHGKAELYRDLMHHLDRSTDTFEIAPGDRGMVMVVFTLPSYDIVFKVIRDTFDYPKTTTRRHVLERYQLVFKHDRAGRLVDAQEFEHLAFPIHRFSEQVLGELRESAGGSIVVDGDRVVIKHVYTERRVTPLNLYLRHANEGAARDTALDYGQAIRDLAATNIFPGDLLLKNFGVTRHGRVIFYDYDELCLLTDCNFREMPKPRDVEEEMAAEPWFYVGPGDVFPEEFISFLGLYGVLREVFLEAHAELLTADFWARIQARHRAGEVVDIFPYRPARRLRQAARPEG